MTRKTIAQLTLSLLIAGMAGLLIWAAVRHNSKLSGIRNLPDFSAVTVGGEAFDTASCLDPSKRTALLFFHPECEYCRKELEGILARHAECRNTQWLFFTLAPSESVAAFLAEYPLDSLPDAYVLREDWPDIFTLFGVKGPPALFVYDEDKELMMRHMGATSIETIVREMQ